MPMTDNHCIVTRLYYFEEDEAVDVDDPPLSEVLTALRTLDGMEFDTFMIMLINGDSMSVGGGKNDRYKCHARTKGSFFDLVNPTCPMDEDDTESIMMDQELTGYPKCLIVSFDMIINAVHCFATSGQLNPNLKWDDTFKYEPMI